MRSIRLQLLVTLIATLVAAGFLVHRGPPPAQSIVDAVRYSTAGRVHRCLDWGVDPNIKTDMNFSAPTRKSSGGWYTTFAMAGYTRPLILAAQGAREDVVQLLIQHGADVNASSWKDFKRPSLDLGPWRTTALNEAIEADLSTDTVKILLDAGADVNAQTLFKATPLTRALRHQRYDLAKMLIRLGADVNVKDIHDACVPTCVFVPDDETPLSLAIKSGDRELIDLVRQHGATE